VTIPRRTSYKALKGHKELGFTLDEANQFILELTYLNQHIAVTTIAGAHIDFPIG